MNRIVVGVDGSAGSAAALAWAVALAERWPAQLTAVLAWEVRAPALAPHPPLAQAEAEMQQAAEAVMDAMLTGVDTSSSIERRIVNGPVVSTLVDAASEADLLVVGAHGTDGLIAGIGSMAARSAVHSTVPTAVVPAAGEAAADGPVVVGVDGSAGGVRALHMALRLAAPDRAVQAVNAWTVPAITGPAIAALDPDIFAEGGQIALDETLATLSDEDRARVTPRLEHGPSRTVLRRSAEEASMVVVGTRGHSTLLHRLLGSSVTYLLHHQPTVIVVVPAEADPGVD